MDAPRQKDWVVKLQDPHNTEPHGDTRRNLLQLESIPRHIRKLRVIMETASDIAWPLLGDHFTSIEDLTLEPGWNGGWTDTNLPTHWPLKRLVVKGFCSNVLTTPFVSEGRVEHLVLFLTCGLEFEGPKLGDVWDIIHGAERKQDNDGNPEIAETVVQHVQKRYRLLNYTGQEETEDQPQRVPTKMTKLEILENDAIETFSCMMMELPHVVESLSVLNIRSTNDYEFPYEDEEVFLGLFPVLQRLDTLVLTVADVSTDESTIENLYKYLPPNISTLRFRGPTCITECTEWGRWVESFASSAFLPKLQRLSFVLDLYFDPKVVAMYNDLVPAPEHVLKHSQEACKVLHRAAEKRGVVIEPFIDGWSEKCALFQPVDSRWIQE